MPAWDADDCVAVFRNEAGIPDTGAEFTAANICDRLARAQEKVLAALASRYANAFYQAPTALTTADGGKTFTFGTDAQGQPIVPMGWVQIAPNLSAFTDNLYFTGWVQGRDYLDEGKLIRIPSNRAYGGTLYARFVPYPPDINNASTPKVDPILNPPHARNLIVLRAVSEWAAEGGQKPTLAATAWGKYKNEFVEAMTMYKTRYQTGGGLLDPARWYFATPDLGTTG